MTYDADGNLTGDARWIYRWDGEGRLSELETKATAGAVGLPMVKLVFGYDAGSRRVMKRVYANLGGTTTAPIWVLQNDVRFVYVGWHMIGEVELKGNATDAPAGGGANPPPFLRRSWLWGEDLTGTAPAAVGDQRKLGAGGGVGGLLAVTRHARGDQPAESYWATSDLNGNVIGLLATSSTKTAVYDYDPFGQPIRVNEPEAGLNPVRFSSKYTDAETGLCYYGYRYYSPEVGRWVSRDPIGEKGGLNLYGMLGNDPVGRVDVFGMKEVIWIVRPGLFKPKTFEDGDTNYLVEIQKALNDVIAEMKKTDLESSIKGRPTHYLDDGDTISLNVVNTTAAYQASVKKADMVVIFEHCGLLPGSQGRVGGITTPDNPGEVFSLEQIFGKNANKVKIGGCCTTLLGKSGLGNFSGCATMPQVLPHAKSKSKSFLGDCQAK